MKQAERSIGRFGVRVRAEPEREQHPCTLPFGVVRDTVPLRDRAARGEQFSQYQVFNLKP